MADRGFEQDEDLSLLWKTEGLTYIKTCLHYGRQRVGVIWRLVSIMAERGLSYMKTCLHYGRQRVWLIWRLFSIMADRVFELYEDFSPSWLTEGLSKMKIYLYYGKQTLTYIKTCLHYGRQRVGVIWRLVTIMADRGFELYEDFSPSWLFSNRAEGLSKMKIYLYYGKQRVWLI